MGTFTWLPPEIGQPVAASATLIFVVMLVSGLIYVAAKAQTCKATLQNKMEHALASNELRRYPEAKAADKLLRMNYDIHTGGILGLPGKIIAFLAGLVFASLPITVFSIWYGRTYKKKKESQNRSDEPRT
jgi:uncharacterized iron-regulated membrane protein